MKVDKTFNTYEEALAELRRLPKVVRIAGAHIEARTDSLTSGHDFWYVVSLHREGCRCEQSPLCPVVQS